MSAQQTQHSNYGFSKTVNVPYKEAIEKARAALKNEGFGVLCEIDIKEKLKEKLGVDFRNYMILSACNPALAYQTLQEEINIGLLLPCNVIVYETEGSHSRLRSGCSEDAVSRWQSEIRIFCAQREREAAPRD